jgi:hypothetical protein
MRRLLRCTSAHSVDQPGFGPVAKLAEAGIPQQDLVSAGNHPHRNDLTER